jgi:hypothetical protein
MVFADLRSFYSSTNSASASNSGPSTHESGNLNVAAVEPEGQEEPHPIESSNLNVVVAEPEGQEEPHPVETVQGVGVNH